MHKVVIARPVPQRVADHAAKAFDAYLADHTLNPKETIEALAQHGAAGLVLGSNLKIDAKTAARLSNKVKVVATTSVGFDHLDVPALKARGITVTYNPFAATDCTADLTIMLLLCAARRAHEYNALVRAGWGRKLGFEEMLGIRFSGKTLGIIGMGRIGQAVARRARGFGVRIVYHDIRRLPETLEHGAVFYEDLDAMLPACEFLSLHTPASNAPLMDARRLALLPDRAVLVNAGRGSLVDEKALISALTNGTLAAAGLDTFANEPHVNGSLTKLNNVFVTPHMGTGTIDTREELGLCALENVSAVLNGKPALNPL